MARSSLLALLLLALLPTAMADVGRVAILYVYPNDANPAGVYSQAELQARADGPLSAFWVEQSYGRYQPEVTAFTAQLPVDSATAVPANGIFVIDMLNAVLPDGGNLVVPGYDPDDFDLTLVLLGGGNFGFAGGWTRYAIRVNGVDYDSVSLASFTYFHPEDPFYTEGIVFSYYEAGQPFQGRNGGDWLIYPELGLNRGDDTLLHEWGHALGLTTHANYWRSETEPLYGELYWRRQRVSLWDQTGDYGNLFDIMGGSPRYALHINAFYKDLLGWFDEAEKVVVTESMRDLRLHPLQSQSPGTAKAVQIPIPPGVFSRPEPFDSTMEYAFYVEYRRALGLDRNLAHPYVASNTEGLMVTMNRRFGDGFINGWLLDMSPDGIVYDPAPDFVNPGGFVNADDHHEATLNRGLAFHDVQTGVTLTNVRPDGDDGVWFDVEIGAKPGLTPGIHTIARYAGDSLFGSGDPNLYDPALDAMLALREDGRLVVSALADGAVIWDGIWAGVPVDNQADRLVLVDGDLRLLAGEQELWNSDTAGHPEATLSIQRDGQLTVVDGDGSLLWPLDQITPAVDLVPLVERLSPAGPSLADAVLAGASTAEYRLAVRNAGTLYAADTRLSARVTDGLLSPEWSCTANASCVPNGGPDSEADGIDLDLGEDGALIVTGELDLDAEFVRFDLQATVMPGLLVDAPEDDRIIFIEPLNDDFLTRDGFEG